MPRNEFECLNALVDLSQRQLNATGSGGGGGSAGATKGSLTNQSGTISGTTTVAATNNSRNFFYFENTGNNNMRLIPGSGPGILIYPGGSREFSGSFIPTNAITVTGTNGDTFTAYEG